MIGFKVSGEFFNQLEAKPKPIALCTHEFSRALSKSQVIARNSDWFTALFAPAVIGRSNNFGKTQFAYFPFARNLVDAHLQMPLNLKLTSVLQRLDYSCQKLLNYPVESDLSAGWH